MTQSIITKSTSHKLLYLLLALLALLLLQPFIQSSVTSPGTIDLLFICVFITILHIFRHDKNIIVTTIIITTPIMIGRLSLYFAQEPWLIMITFVFGALFFFYGLFIIIKLIMNETRVSFDTIYGAISAYLMLGIACAFLFTIATYWAPGALITQNGKALFVGDNYFHTMIYYSFTSLTTLGFGDLIPISTSTRTLSYIEAIAGQIYLMVLVARLVGLHIAHHQKHRP